MNKTVKIDLSNDRLLCIAAEMVESHNYINALKMLNKNAELHCNDADSFSLYAEIYDDVGLYEKSVNNWFRFLDCADGEEYNDAYEGLAVAYMNLGNEHFSAYYYNKILMGSGDIGTEERGEILNSFLSREPNPLKFVYPPEAADYDEEITNGVEKMKQGEYEDAVREFDKVEEGNASYCTARNFVAMCKVICDKCDEAEAECLALLEKHPDNVQALTTLAAVKTEQKKSEESILLAKRLLKLDVTSTDEIYKIATVCCENKMHEEAYKLFCKLEDELFYDSSLLYFKAVSAYNCGKYNESFDAFDRLITLFPDAVTAKKNFEAARRAYDTGNVQELSYFCRLSKEEREKTLEVLAAFSKLPRTEAVKLSELVDLSECVRWCFDETEGVPRSELELLAAECAVKAGMDGIVCDLLLNAFVSDALKVQILMLLCERNEDNSFGVVICHMYKRVTFRAIKLGRLKRKFFISAYSRLCAHFAIIDSDFCEEFANCTENLYNEMEEGARLALATDVDALAAAIYLKSGVSRSGAGLGDENLYDFFETDVKKVSGILGEI